MTRPTISAERLIHPHEIAAIIEYAHRRMRARPNAIEVQRNLVIFRLACCCGLRAGEVAGLDLRDVRTRLARPYIDLRADICKRKRPRTVPLVYDHGTLADLDAWKQRRQREGATETDPFVARTRGASRGRRITADEVNRFFKSAVRVPLGRERSRQLCTHAGRHTFATLLALDRPLHIVQRALGHARLDTTAVYLHVYDPAEAPGRLFEPSTLRSLSPSATEPTMGDKAPEPAGTTTTTARRSGPHATP